MSSPPGSTGASERRRLDSWKEIAAYLGRTVRTVQRWERDEGLPVHRHLHNRLGSVYAYADEIDRWWAQGRVLVRPLDPPKDATPPEPARNHPEPPPGASRAAPRLLGGLLAAVLLLAVGFGAWSRASREEVGGGAAARAASGPTDLYRRGRLFWQQRTPQGFDQARHAFEDAIGVNPDDARAHAGLADTYSLLEAFGLMAPAEALTKARAAAERAVGLDPNLGEAHASLAFVLWELHDTAAAMTEMERALEFDPDYATAHHWYGLFLQQFLRREEAIAEMRRAVALDPSQPVFWTDLASMLRFARRFDEAEAVLREARDGHQGFPDIYVQLSDLASERGEPGQAVVLLRRAVALGDNRPRILAKLGCLEGTTGNPNGATEALNLLRDMEARGQHVPDDAFAALLAWTGDLDGAFRHIRRGLDERQEWVSGLSDDPGCFAPVRDDPRWEGLLAELEQATWLPLGSRVAPREVKALPKPLRGNPGGGF